VLQHRDKRGLGGGEQAEKSWGVHKLNLFLQSEEDLEEKGGFGGGRGTSTPGHALP